MTKQQQTVNSRWHVGLLLLLTLWLGFTALAHQNNPDQDYHHHHQCRLFNAIGHALSALPPVVIVTPQTIECSVIVPDDLCLLITAQPRARDPPTKLS